jgi:predicted RNA binding protein YcfA (HicA-like mRNA interferase family)
MSRKLPKVSGRDVIRALGRLGFEQIRQRGSHGTLRRETAEGVVGFLVPLHRELAEGTLRGILKQAHVSQDEFIDNL